MIQTEQNSQKLFNDFQKFYNKAMFYLQQGNTEKYIENINYGMGVLQNFNESLVKENEDTEKELIGEESETVQASV